MTYTNYKFAIFSALIMTTMIPLTMMSSWAAPQSTIDTTDYVALWMGVDKEIQKLNKLVSEDKGQIDILKKQLEEMKPEAPEYSSTQQQLASLEDGVAKRQSSISALWDEVNRLEQLNIQSYKVDPETERKLNMAETAIREKYPDEFTTGNEESNVEIIFSDTKHREIAVTLNPSVIEKGILVETMNSIRILAADVPVRFEFGEFTLTSCSGRESPCDPLWGWS